MNYQTSEEKQFKSYLEKELLYRKGYKRYADELKDYYVNLTDDPRIIAAIDPKNFIVYINREHMYDNPDTLSMLIRHELLHSFLNHNEREIRAIAYELGYDPDDLTKVDFEDILKEMGKANFAYRQYNSAHSGNIAGDLDLSRYYLEKDIEITKELGGLLLEDHPEWMGLSFEEIRQAVVEEGKSLKRRAMKKAYGNFIDDNNFEVEDEEDSQFNSNVIAVEDLKDVSVPYLEEATLMSQIAPDIPANDFWLRDKFSKNDEYAYFFDVSSNSSNYTSVENERSVIPVLTIKNADLYKKAQAGEEMECLGKKWLLIPDPEGDAYKTSKLFCVSGPIGDIKFNDLRYQGNDYKGSNVDVSLRTWFDRLKNKA